MKKTFGFILFLCCLHLNLIAEIETVTIKWTGGLCQESCVRGLRHYFSALPGVAEISIDQIGAQAVIKWKPDVRFSYQQIYTTMSQIGLYMREIRIRARGTIAYDARNVRLISLGDNTSFLLINPILPVKNQYVEENNEENRSLTQATRDKLIEASQNNEIVLIEGPLFEPERSPPMMLIAERIEITKNDKEASKKPRTFGFQFAR